MFFTLSRVALAMTVLSFTSPAVAQLQAAEYQGCYSSISPMTTQQNLTFQFQAGGWCQQQCGLNFQKAAFGLTKGDVCYCGDLLPSNSTKVDDSQCNRPCFGYGTEMCGGMSTYSVWTSGLTASVQIASDAQASSAAASSSTTTQAPTASTAATVSMVTKAGSTVFVTSTPTADSQPTKQSSGPSKAGIAAGAVVGVVAIAAIAGGLFFYFRLRSRREIEQEHKRHEAFNFARSGAGTIKSEHSGSDSRMDPTMHFRRQSDGSIADDIDVSRRVLTVTNPDRNTMIA